jgi:iron complex transport system ATP-binding protein
MINADAQIKPSALSVSIGTFGYNGHPVVSAVRFEVMAGEWMFIVGPNGAGKSTTLKIIAQLINADCSIMVKGEPVSQLSRRTFATRIGYAPQSHDGPIPYRVDEFCLLSRYPYLTPFSSLAVSDYEAVHDALALSGVTLFAKRRVDTLSGGERRKVFIAAALSQGAEILLLDEPTAFLDPKSEADIMATLAAINAGRKVTLIQVTHDLNQAALHGDRILGLREGRAEYYGAPAQFMTDTVLEKVFDKKFHLTPHPLSGDMIVLPQRSR